MLADNLISKVARHLPQEIDASRGQRWDEVLVNRYLCDVREAKKQGRKERRHKEAQAVLAAATAAAAASSRTSSFRKDALDESAHQEVVFFFHFPSVYFLLFTSGFFPLPSRENLQLFNAVIHLVTLTWFQKYNTSNGRAGISSQLMPRPKEMLSRVAVPRISSEKYSDFVQSISDFSKDHPGPCDICRRFETILNPILVCSGCKVFSNGPWYFLLAAYYLLASCC